MAECKDEILDDSSDSTDTDDDSSSTDQTSNTKSSRSSSPSSSSSSSSSTSSSSSENAGENDDCNIFGSSERADSFESVRRSRSGHSNAVENSPARVVSNDGIIVEMDVDEKDDVAENHCDQMDEGELDLVIRDECNETHDPAEEIAKWPRCLSAPLTKDEDFLAWKRAHSAEPYRYKRPDPVICAESVEIECLMHRAQFFLARACEENINLAMKTSLWTTHPFVEKLLAEAYRRAPVVILVFLAKKADHFAGFAQMCSEAQYKGQPAMRWIDFRGGGNIKLQWITKCSLPLSATDHIKNPFNKEKLIYAASDGCEIQRAAGQRLCSLFPFDESTDLNALRAKIRQKSRKPKNGLPSLLENEISYSEFRQAKRNLPVKKSIKDLLREERPPLLLSSSKHDSHDGPRRNYGGESYSLLRPPPLMDVAVPYPPSSTSRFSSTSWRKRPASPLRLSPKRRTLVRDHRHRSRSTDRGRKYSIERPSTHRYDSYSSQSSSRNSWRESINEERDRHGRHSVRHRY